MEPVAQAMTVPGVRAGRGGGGIHACEIVELIDDMGPLEGAGRYVTTVGLSIWAPLWKVFSPPMIWRPQANPDAGWPPLLSNCPVHGVARDVPAPPPPPFPPILRKWDR